MALFEAVSFFFSDYARLVAAGVIALSVASVVFRLLWEFR